MSATYPSMRLCGTPGCIIRYGHADQHMDGIGERFTDDPMPWLCGDPDPDNADLDRHDRAHEPYHCGAVWAPRIFCPSGCGCQPGEADMRDCACDGPCVFDEEWRGGPMSERKLTIVNEGDWLRGTCSNCAWWSRQTQYHWARHFFVTHTCEASA